MCSLHKYKFFMCPNYMRICLLGEVLLGDGRLGLKYWRSCKLWEVWHPYWWVQKHWQLPLNTHPHLTTLFLDYLGGPVPERWNQFGFYWSKRQWGISWAICKSASRSRQITMPVPHHSSFLQAECPSCRPTNSFKALKAQTSPQHWIKIGKLWSSNPGVCCSSLYT